MGFSAALCPADPSHSATDLTIEAASESVRRKAISPVELTKACLSSIERLNPRLNAFITVTAEQALRKARVLESEVQNGGWRGPLHGIPIALKDIIDTAGVRTSAGSAVFKDRVPQQDAEVVRRLLNAGAIVLGKLNTAEFAFSPTSAISYFGPVRNPWNPEYDAGGSSSGAGAAVAARLCFAAIGTDTGGSIRIPAARCGVTGLRPTYGRVSTTGVIPQFWSYDTVGPICRSVHDIAVVLAATAGYDAADPASVRTPVADYIAAANGRTRRFRIGVPRAGFFDDLDAEVERAVAEAVSMLRSQVKTVIEVRLPPIPEMSFGCEPWSYHERLIADNASLYNPIIRERFLREAGKCGAAYSEAKRRLELARRSIEPVFADADVLITPTIARLPKTLSQALQDESHHSFAAARNTVPFSTWGLPAMSVPCGFSSSGLPIGLQIVGARFREVDVVSLGHAYEQVSEWHRRRPNF
jgi:aspartyl-tRNA(Asn)/glutamyl-tRNA(Gln) amidotransferase subunit A